MFCLFRFTDAPKCNREYSALHEAEACENSHLEAVSVRAKQYAIGKYPYLVEVAFSNGAVKIFELSDMKG